MVTYINSLKSIAITTQTERTITVFSFNFKPQNRYLYDLDAYIKFKKQESFIKHMKNSLSVTPHLSPTYIITYQNNLRVNSTLKH